MNESEAIFLALVDLPPGERSARLAAVRPGLRAEVESMLADLEAGAWLEAPLCDPTASIAAVLDDASDAVEVEPEIPRRIGPYRIRRLLGRGGHAAVYLAWQTGELRRWVALKVLFSTDPDGAAAARFEAERRTLAALDHRGIPRIFEAGHAADGRPYFAMEIVRGDWITRWCRERSLDRRARIELFREALDAVAGAHARGVIHRDLKPANVMVGETGGRPQVKVIDFGIARGGTVSGAAVQATDGPGLLGSLATLSPEQVRGGAEAASERSDVYALGAILFELLADRPPRTLAGRSLGELVRDIADREPPRLSAVVSSCRGDLDAIVGKAMAFEARDRYATVAEFDADLGRYLAGEPVAARVPGTLERSLRWARRRRRRLLVAGAIVAAMGLLAHLDHRRIVRMDALREMGRLNALLEEEYRLGRERGSEPERRRLLGQVLDATAAPVTAGFLPEERAGLRARALVADCDPVLREEGDPARRAMLDEAVALRRIELAARPDDPVAIEGLSIALVRRGDTDPARAAMAIEDYRAALAIDERLHREHPEFRRYHDNLVWSHERIGCALRNLGRIEESDASFGAMAAEARRLLAAHPESAITALTAAHAIYTEASIRAGGGDLRSAASAMEAAAEVLEQGIRRDPSRGDLHLTRAATLASLAYLEATLGRMEAASEFGQRAIESQRLLSMLDAAHFRTDLALAVHSVLVVAREASARGDVASADRSLSLASDSIAIAVSLGPPSDGGTGDRWESFPFGGARISLVRDGTAAIEAWITDLTRPGGSDLSAETVCLTVVELLACAEQLAATDPALARDCRAAARTWFERLRPTSPDRAMVAEIRARLALAEGRPDEAMTFAEGAVRGAGEPFNPGVTVRRGTLLAKCREAANRDDSATGPGSIRTSTGRLGETP